MIKGDTRSLDYSSSHGAQTDDAVSVASRSHDDMLQLDNKPWFLVHEPMRLGFHWKPKPDTIGPQKQQASRASGIGFTIRPYQAFCLALSNA